MLDPILLSTFPAVLAQKYLCLPLWKERSVLHLVMADPYDAKALSEIESALRMKVKPAKADESEIRGLIERVYGDEFQTLDLEELARKLAESPPEESDRILAALLARVQVAKVLEASTQNKGGDLYEFKLSVLLKRGAWRPGDPRNG
jgi:hypothetical protein